MTEPDSAAIGPETPVLALVVNYNAGEALVACVRSLLRNEVARVVVVDNSSTDGSPDLLEGDDRTQVVDAGSNLGFGGAVNRGLRGGDEPLVLICNPDIVVGDGAVQAMAETLSDDPRLAVVGPRLVNERGETVQSARSFPTIGRSWRQAFAGLVRPSGSTARAYQRENWDQAKTGRVDWVTGACMLARRAALDELGGFDDGYFLYVEEVDLCWRLARAGWQVAYQPLAVVEHIGGHSASKHPYRVVLAHHRSLWRFAFRTTSGRARWALPLVAVAIGVRCVVALAIQAVPGRHTAVEAAG